MLLYDAQCALCIVEFLNDLGQFVSLVGVQSEVSIFSVTGIHFCILL